jgi:hypothetical protein
VPNRSLRAPNAAGFRWPAFAISFMHSVAPVGEQPSNTRKTYLVERKGNFVGFPNASSSANESELVRVYAVPLGLVTGL